MKLPLATSLKNRSSTTDKDARLLNCVVDSRKRVQTRPAMIAAFDAVTAGQGTGLFQGLGLFVRNTPGAPNVPNSQVPGSPSDATAPTTGGGAELIVITNNGSGGGGSGGLTDAVLTIYPTSAVYQLAFGTQPSDWKILYPMSPSVTVRVEDGFGNLKTSFSNRIRISLLNSDPFPNNATLSGTTEVDAVGGIATFSNLMIDRVGANYQFKAESVFVMQKDAISDFFSIKSYLIFTVQPTNTAPTSTMSPPVELSVVDSAGAAITSFTGITHEISVALPSFINTGSLSGNTNNSAVNGVTTFSNLSINVEGTYILEANARRVADLGAIGLARVYSNSFSIATMFLVATGADEFVGYDVLGTFPGSSITPTSYNGKVIRALYCIPPASDETVFVLTDVVSQNFFTSLTLNGVTLLSADATFTGGPVNSQWEWLGIRPITVSGSYAVAIV